MKFAGVKSSNFAIEGSLIKELSVKLNLLSEKSSGYYTYLIW